MRDGFGVELEPGDSVKFIGYNPRLYETVGTFLSQSSASPAPALVEWTALPGLPKHIHPSQIVKVGS